MKHIELKGVVREAGNKATVKSIRKQGLVPCNIYGSGIENVLFTVSAKDLKALTHTPNSYIVELELNDGKKFKAVLHEVQWHPVTDEALHVDFLAISDDKPVVIDVPVVITGHSEGVKLGGKLPFQHLVRKAGLVSPLDPGALRKIVAPVKRILKEEEEKAYGI